MDKEEAPEGTENAEAHRFANFFESKWLKDKLIIFCSVRIESGGQQQAEIKEVSEARSEQQHGDIG